MNDFFPTMSDSTEQKFRAAVRTHLAELEAPLTDVLRKLVAHAYPPEVFALSFEVFSDSFTDGFPARAFFMDRDNCEHFVRRDGKAAYPAPVDPGLLEIERVYPEELEEQVEEEAPEIDTWEIAGAEFIAWFSACWDRAGGAGFALCATIARHDSGTEFNLRSKAWQDSGALFE